MLTQTVCPVCGAINRINGEHDPLAGRCGKCHETLALGAPVEVDDDGFDRTLRYTHGLVLVDVWAPWCGPCRTMAPEFSRAAEIFAGKARLLKLNADASQRAQSLGISGIPALILFRDGKIIARKAGLTRADDLVRWALAHAGAFQSTSV